MRDDSYNGPRLMGKRYEVLGKIGEGGMGAVYKVADRLTGMLVALKQVTAPTDQLDFSQGHTASSSEVALANEFKILGGLRHPNIVSVLDYGFDEARQPFFTMDLLKEPRAITDATVGQSFEAKIHILMQVLQALAYLHQRDIIHRDLKPANVLVSGEGEVKVLDFGLALSAEYTKMFSNSLSGTLAYIAPELLRGQPVSIASDLYAFGLIMYEVLCEEYPYNRTESSRLIRDILMTNPDLALLDIRVRAIVGRLLEKDPQDRYANVDELMQAIIATTDYDQPIETLAIRESYLEAARFVGREQELLQLQSLMRNTMDGQGSILLIGGESGVGKSRLLNELRVSALLENVLVLRGRAVANSGGLYRVWRDVLRWLAVVTELEDLEASVLKQIVPDIETVLAHPVEDAPDLQPEAARERFANIVFEILDRQTKPLVIMLEDLHWAGDESLQLVERMASLVAQRPILILGTYRNDERPDVPENIPSADTLMLPRFDEAEMKRLSRSILGEYGEEPQIVEFLKRETAGNTFFVIEVLRALAEEAGSLRDIAQMPLPDEIVASGIVAILRQRIERLPDAALPLLRLAALYERELDLSLLRHIAADTNLERWLRTCSDMAVFDIEDNRWRFTHDKLREYVVHTLREEPAQWRAAHQQLGAAVEALYGDDPSYLPALAYHWAEADVPEQAAQYNERSAEYMMRQGSKTAIDYMERAISFDDRLAELDMQRKIARYSILGVAHHFTGNMASAEEAIAQALTHMGAQPPPDNTPSLILGILGQVHKQLSHRFWASDQIGQRESDWFNETVHMGLLTMPMIQIARNNPLKMLYSILLSVNTLETLQVQGPANPVMGYGWMQLTLGMLPLRGLAQHYRSLAREIVDDEAQFNALPENQRVGILVQLAIYDFMNGEWASAETILRETAIPSLEQRGELFSLEQCWHFMGMVAARQGRFRSSLEFLRPAYQQSRRRGDHEMQFALFVSTVASHLHTATLNSEEFDDLALLNADKAATAFAKPFETNSYNRVTYDTLRALYALSEADYTTAYEIVLSVESDLSGAGNDRGLAAYDLLDVLGLTCLMLRQLMPDVTTAQADKLLAILAQTNKELARYSRPYVFGQSLGLVYQGWQKHFEGKTDAAHKLWQEALTRAEQLQTRYHVALAHLALSLSADGDDQRTTHRRAAQAYFEEEGGLLIERLLPEPAT